MRLLNSMTVKAALISLLLLMTLIGIWSLATQPKKSEATAVADAEYAALMGKGAEKTSSGLPPPTQVAKAFVTYLSDPFYDKGPNDKGIGIQIAHSLARVGLGFFLAVLVALPLGFAVGMSPLLMLALNPFIQILKPISPLAWMPLALYTLKDADVSGIFVIFICSLWPMLINTAFGVASVRKDWINVARTLEVSPLRKAFLVILPAAAPTILTVPAHGEHMIGKKLAESQIALVRFWFQLIGRCLLQRYFKVLVEHLSTLFSPVSCKPVFIYYENTSAVTMQ